ncbi:MAG: malate:quinone oxidoreductase [Vulcanimicrobiaceae bacterium]
MPDAKAGGKLEFGTKIVAAGDGSLSAVLGASPGASGGDDDRRARRCFQD